METIWYVWPAAIQIEIDLGVWTAHWRPQEAGLDEDRFAGVDASLQSMCL